MGQAGASRRASSAWPNRAPGRSPISSNDELVGLVTQTIERSDATEASSQLELLLGRDLQYIRVSGAVVGARVGLALHSIVLAPALMVASGFRPGHEKTPDAGCCGSY